MKNSTKIILWVVAAILGVVLILSLFGGKLFSNTTSIAWSHQDVNVDNQGFYERAKNGEIVKVSVDGYNFKGYVWNDAKTKMVLKYVSVGPNGYVLDLAEEWRSTNPEITVTYADPNADSI